VLTKHGASVVGVGRNVEELEKLKSKSEIVDYVLGDLTAPNACKTAVDMSTLLAHIITVAALW
jgi:NADP-dependent 3-hydroxy acid dehydrogenase YdfG